MTTSSVLGAAWTALEQEVTLDAGLYERRVFANSGFAVYAGVVRPGANPRVSVIVPSSVLSDGLERETRGFRVFRNYNPVDHTTRVTLELSNGSFRELFEVMAEDVASRVLAAADQSAAVIAMRGRLDHWERFMRLSGNAGLDRNQQIGLFGELLFLQTLLETGVSAGTAVAAWKGPRGTNQDFQCDGRALEVKTTSGNSATSIVVSNELQLDETESRPLFLLHLWMRVQDGGGVTLPMLVGELAAMLSEGLRQDFNDRLVQAGYHDIHRSAYDEVHYVERARHYYVVDGAFPRIGHGDLRPGVSHVGYRIDVAGFEGFCRAEADVIHQLVDAES
jgi:hypothetical protein